MNIQSVVKFDCMQSSPCAGCRELKTALTEFIDESLDSVAKIKKSVQSGSALSFRKNVKRLKQGAYEVGALSLAESCTQLETAARSNQWRDNSEIFSLFDSQFEFAMAFAVKRVVSIELNIR